MLTHLTIRNIVLIESLELAPAKGLCVLTGETGAGKSILLDALGLLLGSRADSRLIRQGEDTASVAGEFTVTSNKALSALLKEFDIQEEDTLRIRRSISRDGKGKVFLNDVPVGQGVLQQAGELLVEIHGQHDQRSLTSTTAHRQLLDSYAGLDTAVEQLGKVYDSWQATQIRYQQMLAGIAKAQAEEDFLRHALGELTELDPQPGEEDSLAAKRTMLQHRAKLLETLQAVQELFTEKDVTSSIRAAERILDRSIPQGIDVSAIRDALDKAGNELQEAMAGMERLAADVGDESDTLDKAEERLFALRAAARKYQCTVEELPAHRDGIVAQLKALGSQAEDTAALAAEVQKLKAEYAAKAEAISKKRTASATKMAKAVEGELAPLKMASCKFQVNVTALEESQWGREGMDRVEFQASTNPGMPFGSLSKIASGGELSRLMLAIKVVLSGSQTTPTLIFDEIDAGVGGAVADAIGKRLSVLGESVQVFCVTHLPQVASYGTQHFRVEKRSAKGSTVTSVKELSGPERREEIARMLAGDSITAEARAAADRLMEVR